VCRHARVNHAVQTLERGHERGQHEEKARVRARGVERSWVFFNRAANTLSTSCGDILNETWR
jgi:hypothetical protein